MAKVVLSASRRTEILRFPEYLVKTLAKRYPPEDVHTIILWTKKPHLMFAKSIRTTLKRYNLFILCTITGLGGTFLEPNIPRFPDVAAELPKIIDEFLDGVPAKIHVRFDPILNLVVDGKTFTNLDLFPKVSTLVAHADVKIFRVSWATYYPKVKRRFDKLGLGIADFDLEEQARYLMKNAEEHGLEVRGCCVDPTLAQTGIRNVGCIDGAELQELHPDRDPYPEDQATGQRALCRCTRSIDVGWYSMVCPNGCVYCYANPADQSEPYKSTTK
ncbi:MAG: DUF1848 family protein [Candidatus Bathyarchaeota archaeon]|nr:MAG: DUF1848 family protein [Candidatus Bathyarchaeota archaeon]